MTQVKNDIRFIGRQEIDIEKWDHCIQYAFNGLIYARSFYLDSMAKNWSALILNDYQSVMPLVWNRKFGFTYLYQPAFTAQLGFFCQKQSDRNRITDFIEIAKTHFSFCEMHLNNTNIYPGISLRANYTLDLGKPYFEIRKGYHKRLIADLRRAALNDLSYLISEDYKTAIQQFKKEYSKTFRHGHSSDYLRFEKLCQILHDQKMILLREIRDGSGKLINIGLFFKDERRIYNILSFNLKTGREKRAHFFMLDRLILEYSSQKILLDFEGSEIEGIASFNRKFGPILEAYPFLYFNRLPFPFKYFK